MIVVMEPGATRQQIDQVIQMVRDMGMKEHVIKGAELTVVAVIGDDRKKDPDIFETLPGVQKAMRVLAPYKMSAREVRRQRTVVRLSPACSFGGEQFSIIAGPCSVETPEQILLSARQVKEAGAHALRGGAYKPRTNPFAFQGHGEEGLKMLAAAGAETGLPVVTEVLATDDVELVAQYADCLQIGTRNAQNYRLLEAVGKQPKPVLYKRGMWATIDETLQAVDYILAAGNERVILCERGIRTFERFCRNTYSLPAITELQHRSHLPVIGDPSHGTGHTHLVPAAARATVAIGADGLALEVHPDPLHAWSDGGQSLDPAQFAELVPVLAQIAECVGRHISLPQPA
jgi:3-deoxy-7-phosphoheptulonate synthase